MKSKLLTRFICLMLAMLCLPAFNAFAIKSEVGEYAAATQTVSVLPISIDVPAGGRSPSFEAIALTPELYVATGYDYAYESQYYNNYYKDGVQWYDLDNGRPLKEGDTFVTGTRYRVDIAVRISNAYDFYGIPYYKFADEVMGFINDNRCEVSFLGAKDKKWYRELSYTFAPCEDAPADISVVNLWLEAPVTGATPDFTFTTGDKGFMAGLGGTNSINGVLWYDADTLAPMEADNTFVKGHRYTVAVELNTTSLYRFATNANGTSKVTAYINGNESTVYCTYQTVSNMDKEIWVKYTFDYCDEIINSVEVMGFSLPKEGQNGNISMYSPDDSVYKVEGIVWRDNSNTTIAAWYETGYIYQSGVFEAGVTYKVEVILAAQTGYKFAVDSNDKPLVAASGGGFELEANEHYAYASSSHIIVSGRFICKRTIVSTVNIKGLEEPVAGKLPDYFVSSVGAGYRIDATYAKDSVLRGGEYVEKYYKYAGVSWYDVNEGRYIYEDEKFIQGHVYTVCIDIIADTDNGYEFNVDKADCFSFVEAFVNDNQALCLADISNPQWNNFVEYTVSCHYVFDNTLKGDANDDGVVDNLDAAMILKYDAGVINSVNESAADVNGDGAVDNLDAAMILKYDAGIIDSL